MNAPQPIETTVRGYLAVSPAERAGFGMLSAFGTTVGISRTINYVRERRRHAPQLRSWTRRAYHAPGHEQLRIHHFLPGIGLTFVAGGAAILTRSDGHESWLSVAFGAGAGLVLDEVGLLVKADNPYWGSQTIALAQGAVATLGAAALTVRFHRRGVALLDEPPPAAGRASA